jgi:hypothetical protein
MTQTPDEEMSQGSSMFDPRPWFNFKIGPRWKELREFYESGTLAALYDALLLATESGYPPPDWVVEGALKVVGDRLKAGFPLGKGRSGNELAKYQNSMKERRRWQTVKALKQKKITVEDACADAVPILKKTFAKAKADMIAKSYKRVEKDMKDPKKRLRYYNAQPEVRKLTKTPTIELPITKPKEIK